MSQPITSFPSSDWTRTPIRSRSRLRGARITLCEAFDGTVSLLHPGQALHYSILHEGEPPIPSDDEKSLHQTIEPAKAIQTQRPQWKPAPDHPWRRHPSTVSSP